MAIFSFFIFWLYFPIHIENRDGAGISLAEMEVGFTSLNEELLNNYVSLLTQKKKIIYYFLSIFNFIYFLDLLFFI